MTMYFAPVILMIWALPGAVVVVPVADEQDLDVAEVEAERFDAVLDLRRRGLEIAVDENVALGCRDQVSGQVVAADIIEIAGDAERRMRGRPCRIDRGVHLSNGDGESGEKQEAQRKIGGSLDLGGCDGIAKDLDGALQAHSAGAFDQHHVARAQILSQPATCGVGIGQKQRSNATGAGGGCQVDGISAHADDEVEARFRGGLAARGMERRARDRQAPAFPRQPGCGGGQAARPGCESWSEALQDWSCSCR